MAHLLLLYIAGGGYHVWNNKRMFYRFWCYPRC